MCFNFKNYPDIALQQILDLLMKVFSDTVLNARHGRMVIETDHVLKEDIHYPTMYYMLDLCNDDGSWMFTEDGTRIVCCITCSDGSTVGCAYNYTQAVAFLENLAQHELQHLTEAYFDYF